MELHQHYLVKGEAVLGQFKVEEIKRRTRSVALPAPPAEKPAERQKVCTRHHDADAGQNCPYTPQPQRNYSWDSSKIVKLK